MKITVELSDAEIEEIKRITNEKRKGPAIRKLTRDALRLHRRKLLRHRVMNGEWSVDIPDIKRLREDRRP